MGLLSFLLLLVLAIGYSNALSRGGDYRRLGAGTGNVQLWDCDGGPNQQWNFPPNSLNQITSVSSGACLDVQNYGTNNGANVWAYAPCHPDDKDPDHQNEAWKVSGLQIIEISTGKCLDASGSATTVGTNIQIWDCGSPASDHPNQEWTYNATDKTIRGVASGLCLDAGSNFPPICTGPEKSDPYCDTSLTFEQRVKDLLSRLSVSEKIGLMGNSALPAASIELPAYQWWSEALHGVAGSPGVSFAAPTPVATSFPQVIGVGTAFDRQLWNTIGQTISTEARAFANAGNAGLTFWTPNINIFRDPRWGRGQETPGEDPYLNAEYANAFVNGMQAGEDSRYIKASACCKHYAAYSLEDSDGVDRHHFDGNVSDQDWADTYLPAFQSCVERAHGSIMCSYNANNGIPSCADPHLLEDDLRKSWGFNGYVTGDCGAVDDVLYTHQYTSTTEDTCAVVLDAGLDVDCGGFLQANLQNALSKGTVTEADLDVALTDLFLMQMKLGMFDPAENQPYRQIPPTAINTPENQVLALQAAKEGIVLLKNQGSKLPWFWNAVHTVAVVGPNADAGNVMQGNYYGNAPFLITPYAGIKARVENTTYVKGCEISGTDTSKFNDAITAAKNADATVIVVGLDQSQESEGLDRKNISFPGVQSDFIAQVAAGAKGPVAVVVMSGSSIDLSAIKNNANVDSILFVGYPGQAGGQALAEVLFGDYNPAGRLDFTMYYTNYSNQVLMTDMGMRPNTTTGNPGRTYRFFPGPVIYEFGFGLSYTNFTYAWSSVSEKISAVDLEKKLINADRSAIKKWYPENLAAIITVTVTNTGTVAGNDAVLAFSVPPNPGKDGAPLKSLIGFERIYLSPGETKIVSFQVPAVALALAGKGGVFSPVIGDWKYQVGVGENTIEKVVTVE